MLRPLITQKIGKPAELHFAGPLPCIPHVKGPRLIDIIEHCCAMQFFVESGWQKGKL
jgi:hypothetical protein